MRELHPPAGWLPVLLYFFPNLTDKLRHFLKALRTGLPIGVGYPGELVCVVAEPGHLEEQICVVVAGPCPQFCAHDEGTQEFLARQAARFHLRLQMRQLLFVEMEGDDVISFSHFGTPFCRSGSFRFVKFCFRSFCFLLSYFTSFRV